MWNFKVNQFLILNPTLANSIHKQKLAIVQKWELEVVMNFDHLIILWICAFWKRLIRKTFTPRMDSTVSTKRNSTCTQRPKKTSSDLNQRVKTPDMDRTIKTNRPIHSKQLQWGPKLSTVPQVGRVGNYIFALTLNALYKLFPFDTLVPALFLFNSVLVRRLSPENIPYNKRFKKVQTRWIPARRYNCRNNSGLRSLTPRHELRFTGKSAACKRNLRFDFPRDFLRFNWNKQTHFNRNFCVEFVDDSGGYW